MNYKNLFLKLLRQLIDLFSVIIGLRFQTQRNYLPPITDPILLESAHQLCTKIKSGKVKCIDVVKAYIKRCNEVQPHIHAIIEDSFNNAIIEAIKVDRRVDYELKHNKPLNGQSIHSQPLLGIPFTAKDSFAVKGMPWTSGLYSRKRITSQEDSHVISLMRGAGAIFIAMTNVPELIMWWHSTNILYGRTNNPYDKSRIPGGSSGGEGALIASAGSLIGMGSDIGGSIREPSFFCGLFGHKTTSGVVSTLGIYPKFSESKQKLLSVGPYASDLKLSLKVMAGNNITMLKLDQDVNVSKINVYYMDGHNDPSVTPLNHEIKEAINRVIGVLDKKCAKVEKIYLKDLEKGFDLWMCAMTDPTAPSLERELANLNGQINPYWELLKSIFGQSNYTLPSILSCFDDYITGLSDQEYFQELTHIRQKLTNTLHKLLGTNGVLIYPGHPEIAPKHNNTILKVKNISYTCAFNPLNVSITSVPLGLTSDGLPIGLQVIAGPFNDHLSIAMAEELERAFGGWVSPSIVNTKQY